MACANMVYNSLVCFCTYLNLLDVHITLGVLKAWVREQRGERGQRSEIKKEEVNSWLNRVRS